MDFILNQQIWILKKYFKLCSSSPQERRIERKLNTIAFKEEKQKMEKMMAHNKSRFQVPL